MTLKYLVLTLLAVSSVMGISGAFADHTEVTIIPDTGSGSATDDCVDIEYGCYTPGIATVDLGGKVIFSNTDSVAHTFTAGNPRDGASDVFESGFLASGDSAEYIADTLGEFDYFCMIHPWMEGLIIVVRDNIPDSTRTFSPITSSHGDTTINDLKNQIVSLKMENRNLKQQIILLNNEIEQLEDLLLNGLKEIYNWIS